MEGWVKLHRKIVDWQWFESANHLKLWLVLMLKANHKETVYRDEVIKPGQILTGRKQLAQWTGFSEQQVRTMLDDFKASRELTIKPTKKFSIITLTNWIDHQSSNQEITSDSTKCQPSANQVVTTSKNVNNVISNNITPTQSDDAEEGSNVLDTGFFTGDALHNIEELPVSDLQRNILTLLNTICFRNFRPNKANLRLISARISDGYTLDDFKRVFEFKQKEWGADSHWKKYLQPSTLLGTKFDQYLNQATASDSMSQSEEDAIIARYFPGA